MAPRRAVAMVLRPRRAETVKALPQQLTVDSQQAEAAMKVLQQLTVDRTLPPAAPHPVF